MKKIYTLIAALAVTFVANAQEKGSVSSSTSIHPSNTPMKVVGIPASSGRAVGDTLMYMPLPSTFVYTPADVAGFTIVREDIDLLPPNNAGYAMDFGLYYSTDSSIYGTTCSGPAQGCSVAHGANYYHPWEVPAPLGTDTSFFWSATSWFAPAGVADNWLMFGPLTIPAGGASLKWYDRTNRWRDGYQVLVTSTFSPTLTFGDFINAPIFTEVDDPAPSATYAIDTTWELKSVAIPASFNGMQIAIAFHHNANDMDVLRLDEIQLLRTPLGINENAFVNGVKLGQNMPNPTSANTTITFELENNASVSLNVFDVTGKVVATQTLGQQGAGVHTINFSTENLAAGMYHYSLTVNNATTSAMKMVVIK